MKTRRAAAVAARLLLAAVIIAGGAPAFALNPRLDISQYAHTAWRISDGFPAGVVAIAQTSDGYLWLGTDGGLLRFDGIRAAPWQPPAGQALPSNRIRDLQVTRDGTLWISTEAGLASWAGGKLTSYKAPEEPYSSSSILLDRDGVVWAGVYLPRLSRRILCSFKSVQAECYGQDGGPGVDAIGVFEDSKGQLWVGTQTGVWRWKPAPARFYPLGYQQNGFRALAEDAGGGLLVSRPGRVDRLIDGRIDTPYRLPPAMKDVHLPNMLRDRDGGVWLGGSSRGLAHFHQGTTDLFSEIDGLSSNVVTAIFEDREGSIWVGTSEGLHRFRNTAVANISTRQGLSSASANAVAASPDGSVWISTYSGLTRFTGNNVTVYRQRATAGASPAESRAFRPIEYVTGGGLPAAGVHALFRDGRGGLWAATESGVGYLEHDRFVMVNGIPGGLTRGITEDGEGTIWIAHQSGGLFRLAQGRDVAEVFAWTTVGIGLPTAVVGDPRRGAWIGSIQGRLVHVDGGIRTSYGPSEGLASGRITDLRFDRAGTLWIANQGGLSRVKAGRIATLNAAGGLPCDETQWSLEDDAKSLWLASSCGLVRVSSSEIAAWEAAADRQDSSRRVQVTVFGNADGFRFAPGFPYSMAAVKSTDGRLWFRAVAGVNVLDPRSLPSNQTPPPVHIERITADRKIYEVGSSGIGAVSLPSLTRDLEIDYTALSLVAPERNRFRYKLEGRDTEWQDVGSRRQAFYSDLSPARYRFRVIASNNDGVWNDTGASVDFEIPPAYYQTTSFLALVAGMLLTLVWAAHRVRLRIVETHEREITALNEKLMSAQEQERIRIAGELHDGVMQEMLAATMMLGTAKRRVPDDSEARPIIEKIQQTLIRAGTDIRQLSHDLHPPALQDAGLPDALRTHCEQFGASCGVPVSCDADDTVHELSRGAALALFRIVQEALGNAAKHAQATQISVRLKRLGGTVSLSISDNGVGFERGRLTSSGGLGLITMRERAGQLNGKFEFETAPGRGTTITVVIPFR